VCCGRLAAAPRDGPIHQAARRKDLAALQSILRATPNVVNERGDRRVTALMIASRLHDLKTVQVRGHAITISPKLRPAQCLFLGRCQFLLREAGADVKARDADSCTALHHMALGGLDR
jgi:ankyrin repeat protein